MLILYFSVNSVIAFHFYGGREKTNKYIGLLIDYFLGIFVCIYYLVKEMIKSLLDYTEFAFFYRFYITKDINHAEVWKDKAYILENWLEDTKNPFKRKAYKLLLNEIKNYKNGR